MRYVPTVNDNSLKSSVAVSSGIHIALFIFLYFGLPHIIPPLPPHREPIPVDIVTVAEITNTHIKKEAPVKKAPPPPKQKPPKKIKAAPAPKPPPPQIPVKAEALAPPKEDQKPTPKVEQKKEPRRDLLGSVLKNVAKMKATQQIAEKATEEAVAEEVERQAFALSNRLTITEEDALRRQIEQCWNPPIGARNAENLVVEVVITVNPDRTVANTEVVDKIRYASDSFFRAAADAAVRALRNPKCSPLKLAPDKYQQWKRINFVFDPRDML